MKPSDKSRSRFGMSIFNPKNRKMTFYFVAIVSVTCGLIVILTYLNLKTTAFRLFYRGAESSARQRPKRRPDDVSQFVLFADFKDGRRLGNQIFCFAAVVFVAELTGRRPAMKKEKYITLDQVFDLNVERYGDLCPCYTIYEKEQLGYQEGIEKSVVDNVKETGNKSIRVHGFRQSWKYTRTIERRLRRHLVFKKDVQNVAERFLEDNVPPGWYRAGFVRVGIHVRRADLITTENFRVFGYTVPNATYFERAMKYFTDRYNRVQFIAASDDLNWTREHVTVSSNSSSGSVNVTYSVDHSSGQDLAILSLCDHVIMSTGTYGWWAAWLAKGTTIYYSDWPRNGSALQGQFKRKDFFPSSWIPMDD